MKCWGKRKHLCLYVPCNSKGVGMKWTSESFGPLINYTNLSKVLNISKSQPKDHGSPNRVCVKTTGDLVCKMLPSIPGQALGYLLSNTTHFDILPFYLYLGVHLIKSGVPTRLLVLWRVGPWSLLLTAVSQVSARDGFMYSMYNAVVKKNSDNTYFLFYWFWS